jgi:hypothetical protein
MLDHIAATDCEAIGREPEVTSRCKFHWSRHSPGARHQCSVPRMQKSHHGGRLEKRSHLRIGRYHLGSCTSTVLLDAREVIDGTESRQCFHSCCLIDFLMDIEIDEVEEPRWTSGQRQPRTRDGVAVAAEAAQHASSGKPSESLNLYDLMRTEADQERGNTRY